MSVRIDPNAPATCSDCGHQQEQESGVQRCNDCGVIGRLTVPPLPEQDTFTRKRLTLADLARLYKGTPLLISTVWSNYQALTPVTFLEVTEEAEGGASYKGAERRVVVQYLGTGASPHPDRARPSEARFYLTSEG